MRTERRVGAASASPPLHLWTPEPLSSQVRTAIERVRRLEDVAHIAIMPDVHIAGSVCTGGVVATERLIYPQAIGGDIGCGYAGVALDLEAGAVATERVARALFDRLSELAPFMRHRSMSIAPEVPEALRTSPLSAQPLHRVLEREARIEFGTLGRGNHFLELQADEEGRLWIMVHGGSRALGPAIAAWHAERAGMAGRAALWGLDSQAESGQAFLHDAAIAERYAALSRDRMLQQAMKAVCDAVGPAHARSLEANRFNTSHNHVRHEEHGGRMLWVHRKGANSARVDEFNVIPGSMGTTTFHVRGRGRAESLASSSHGAGRAMTRVEARKRVSRSALDVELGGVWTDPRVRPRLVEEAPRAYKSIERVMRGQQELVRIVRRLRPVLSYKSP